MEKDANMVAGWPAPKKLGENLPAVVSFDLRLLPESLRAWVADIADRMQVKVDLPAAAAMAALAAACGRRALIQPREHDNSWKQVPNLWGALIAPPGTMKTPIINAMMDTLFKFEKTLTHEYEAKLAQFNAENEDANSSTGPRPVQKRLLTNDATVPKLHEMMAANPGGIALILDELTSLLATLDSKGREGDREFYLKAWTGNQFHKLDRIARGSVYAEYICVTIFGGIQPDLLLRYFEDVVHRGKSKDGFLQRFQLLVWPDSDRDFTLRDVHPDEEAMKRANAVYSCILEMDVSNPVLYRFDSEAQSLFNDWNTALEVDKIRNPALAPALQSHLAKFRSLFPSLALLLALADGSTGLVDLAHAKQASGWCTYLESHAKRVYSSGPTPQHQLADKVLKRFRDGEPSFTARDIYRAGMPSLSNSKEVEAAAAVLEKADWLRSDSRAGAIGRPSDVYLINPRLGELDGRE